MNNPALIYLVLTAAALGAPALLLFQGHLTVSSGDPIVGETGTTRVVQFKIYDAPVSGNAVWAGEVHKLSVNKGLVNTILGRNESFLTSCDGNSAVAESSRFRNTVRSAFQKQEHSATDPNEFQNRS